MTSSGGTSPQPPLNGFFNAIRRTGIERASDRWLAGVASGIAHKVGVSPAAVRLILVFCVVFLGLSIWFYVLAWLILPDQRTGRIALQTFLTPS